MSDNTRAATAATPGEASRASRAPTATPRELYAVAVEVLYKQTGEWRPDIRYTHAPDPQAAKFAVLRCIDWSREAARVVGVSRIIGYKVMDKKGLILAV